MADSSPSSAAAPPRLTGEAWALLLVLSVLWGGSFPAAKIAVAEIPPLTLVLLRVGIAGAILLLALRLTGRRLPLTRDLIVGWLVMGLLGNAVPFTLFFTGQRTIGAGVAAILNATTPIFTVIAAHVLTRDEKATRAKILGAILGFCGVAVLIGVELLSGLGAHVGAEILCLAGAVSYALSGIWGRRFRARPPLETAAGQLTASTLLMLPLALAIDGPRAAFGASAQAWTALAALAVICTALAYVLFFRILSIAGATNVLLVTFLVPASAVLMGAAVLGEALGWHQAFGMVLIAAGLAAIDGRAARLLLPDAREERG